jgi:hypothetical protein
VPKKYTYKTPLGEFASAAQAAAAHKCDKGTVINRCKTDPDNYQQRPIPLREPKVKITWSTTARATWPLSWFQYKHLSYEVKEEIWQTWCIRAELDPELESTVDAFFTEMDNTQEVDDAAKQTV